ncbi:MAG: iron-sulfur cluster repair protein YtfE [Azospirillaceae bacterium]|nr:iron-sulfur cluster repair protein YtfE [Azospirillaceae bacterium]
MNDPLPASQTEFAAQTLASLAVQLPGATAVFRRHKLDFCCGGRVSLADAATSRGLALSAVTAELEALAAQAAPLPPPPASNALIDRIETRYHAVHRQQLPELIRLARRVEAVHREHPAVPQGLADLLTTIEQELGSHMQKEEQILFPMLRRGGNPMVAHPIAMMMTEHDDHGVLLRALEKTANGFEGPSDACTTWRALNSGLARFAEDLTEHIHIENNILFPRFLD